MLEHHRDSLRVYPRFSIYSKHKDFVAQDQVIRTKSPLMHSKIPVRPMRTMALKDQYRHHSPTVKVVLVPYPLLKGPKWDIDIIMNAEPRTPLDVFEQQDLLLLG